MARAPPSTIDFAPAWLNLNAGNKKLSKVPDRSHPALPTYSVNPSDKERLSSTLGEHSKYLTRLRHSPDNTRQLVSRFHSVDGDSWSSPNGLIESEQGESFSHLPRASRGKWNYSFVNNSKTQRTIGNHGTAAKSSRDAEFPSLGAAEKKSAALPSSQPDNMWRKPLVLKTMDSETSNGFSNKPNSTKFEQANSIYKSLVPKSNVCNSKQFRRTISVPSTLQHGDESRGNHSSKSGNNMLVQTGSKRTPTATSNRAAAQETSSPVLSRDEKTTMLSATVKRHRRGKNVFLRELREDERDNKSSSSTETEQLRERSSSLDAEKENSSGSLEDNSEMYDDVWDAFYENDDSFVGAEDSKVDVPTMRRDGDELKRGSANSISAPPLSSSLEAEYKLLREMGWRQDDGCKDGCDANDEPPLTDDEIREFFTRNKSKGLLAVPSISHRSFHDALTSWSLANMSSRASNSDSGKEEDVTPSSPDSPLSSSDSD